MNGDSVAGRSAGDDDHLVVVNDEGQHSIWHTDRGLPPGWRPTGFSGTREACLEHIDAVWVDIAPRSARFAL